MGNRLNVYPSKAGDAHQCWVGRGYGLWLRILRLLCHHDAFLLLNRPFLRKTLDAMSHTLYALLRTLQLLAALVLLALAVWTGQRAVPALLSGQRAEGQVTALQERQWHSPGPGGSQVRSARMPQVRFDHQGQTVHFEDSFAARDALGLGDTVQVLVHPWRLDQSVIERGWRNYFPWAPMAGLGVLLLGSALRGPRRTSPRPA